MDSKIINSAHLRDASFSCYLSKPEENFVLKLGESVQNPSAPAITSTGETSGPISLKRTKIEEGEINVFGAEKYFNMKIDDENPRKQWQRKEEPVDLHHTRPRIRPGTPSASSEVSWNSQIALLPSFLRHPSQSKQKKAIGNRFFAGFGCNGSCTDEKSVYIDKNVRKKAIQVDLNPVVSDRIQGKDEINCKSFEKMSVGFNREENFAFPILNSGLQNLTAQRSQLEEARISLEVFGSHMMKKGDIATNLERKLSVLTWDAIPKAQNLPTTSRSSGMCEDNESDASSDLFEIENISGTSGQPLFTRQASDGMSTCMTPTTLYEPSEASIEWSVVTASAVDFSAISDWDEKNSTTRTSKTSKTKSMMGKEAQRSHPTGLLGCTSQKAVRIAETAYRTSEKMKSDPRVKDFEFPQSQRAIASRALSSSHSAHASLPLYMQ